MNRNEDDAMMRDDETDLARLLTGNVRSESDRVMDSSARNPSENDEEEPSDSPSSPKKTNYKESKKKPSDNTDDDRAGDKNKGMADAVSIAAASASAAAAAAEEESTTAVNPIVEAKLLEQKWWQKRKIIYPLLFLLLVMIVAVAVGLVVWLCRSNSEGVEQATSSTTQALAPTEAPTKAPTKSPNIDPGTHSPWLVGMTSHYQKLSNWYSMISPPANPGNMLFLFLSRTDDFLPLSIDGWTRAAECFKSTNSDVVCSVASECINVGEENGFDFCYDFANGAGRDLATVVYYKMADAPEEREHRFFVNGGMAAWGIMISINGVNSTNPIRDVATQSCDNNQRSVFPSVYGEEKDILLLSQAFDDTSTTDKFQPPPTTELVGFISGDDEAGFLWGKKLTVNGKTGSLWGTKLSSAGETGTLTTPGIGGSTCKDALISLTLRGAL